MSSAVSPLAPTDVPDMPAISGVKLATAAAGIRYKGRTDVLLAVHVADAVTRINPEHPGNLVDRLDPQFVERPEVALCLKSWTLNPEPGSGLAQDPAA